MTGTASMDERSAAVLRAAVETYISSAEPVASRALGRKEIHLSSASIRAVMAKLERSGLLYQPHTSAGRVPTTAGYRIYVDQLMSPVAPGAATVRTLTLPTSSGVRPMMESFASRLAAATGLTAFAISAVRDNAVHRQIDLVRLRRGEVLGIFTTRSGTVHQRRVEIDTDIPQAELGRLSNFLNTRFEGLTLREIRRVMREDLVDARRHYKPLSSRAFELGEQALPVEDDPQVDVVATGQHQLLNHPEFAAAHTAGPILEELERHETWLALLDRVCTGPALSVIIGTEHTLAGLQQCSVVAAPMPWDDGIDGSVGLVGPTRLAYARMTTLIQFLAHYMADYAARRGQARIPT
ncbi:MAG: heat-inducible transcriptional repressor [Myxococcota bacterium]|jgi:heat-inducible transcriptional repressor